MNKRNIILLLMASFSLALFSQEAGEVTIDSIEIEYIGKAKTNESTLRSYLDIEEKQVLSSIEELEGILMQQEQMLNNTRYFKSVEISSHPISDGGNSYTVLVKIEDGWTFVPIPYPLPDSAVGNNGWSFGLEVNYDNMFGTMTDLYIDGYVNVAFGEDEKLKEWKINPKVKNIKIGSFKFDVEYTQEYSTTEVTDPIFPVDEQLREHYTNSGSLLKLSSDINLAGLWSYSIAPQVGMNYSFNYHPSFEGKTTQVNDNVVEDRLSFIIEHSIGLGQVDWIGPLRKGYSFRFGNSLKLLNSYDNSTAQTSLRFVPDFSLEGKLYVPLGRRFNYYTKAKALYIINDVDKGMGGTLRGVKNSSMAGDLGFFWLNTMAFEIWGNKSVHIQIHPFADMGIAINTKNILSFEDMFRIGFGTELVVMLGSIDLKGKIGYDPISDYVDFSFRTGLSY